ncbi:Glycosyl transferase family 2 [Candidatus Methanoperedenaceae archaeon GB37]|nr:Glycosyl transferase family 2 [Candidatus Methanoperedenaceae archaeon GB37]
MNGNHHLSNLIKKLTEQKFKDFEVIIVDQSKEHWKLPDIAKALSIYYYHTDIKGAVKARNIGLALALGKVIAFTDDDCEPYPDWLENARKYFKRQEVIGIEGLIKSDHDSNNLRCVSNEGFEGIGFMTANLFVLREMANRVNGFDEAFDNPHFREDTDFAWRLLNHGKIPMLGML